MLISPLCWFAVGHKKIEWNCVQGKLRLDIRKMFFIERLVSHWNRLPRKVSECIECFSQSYDLVLDSPMRSRKLDLGPFQLSIWYDSMIELSTKSNINIFIEWLALLLLLVHPSSIVYYQSSVRAGPLDRHINIPKQCFLRYPFIQTNCIEKDPSYIKVGLVSGNSKM